MIRQYGEELDGLKKKYEGYTRYGLLDEIRKLKEEIEKRDGVIAAIESLIKAMGDAVPTFIKDILEEQKRVEQELEKMEKDFKVDFLEKALNMACKYIPIHTGYCPYWPDKYVTDCPKCGRKQEDWICWKEYFLQKAREAK